MRAFWLVLLLVTLAGADQVVVNGKPWPGRVEGRGALTMVELAPLLVTLDLPSHPTYGGWCVTREADGENCPARELAGPDQVIVQGHPVPARRIDGRLFVNLTRLATELKLKLAEPRPGVLEISREQPPAPPAADYLPVVFANGPGDEVALAQKLVPGRSNIVLFYTDWCPSCWKFWPFLEELHRSRPGLAVVAVNIADFKSAVARQYQVRMTPSLQLYDGAGKLQAEGTEAERLVARTYQVKLPTALKCVGSPDK